MNLIRGSGIMETEHKLIKNKGVDRGIAFIDKELKILKAAGYVFVVRYYSLAAWKRMNRTEAQLISRNGLYAVSVYQDSNDKPELFTNAIGIQQGQNAKRFAQAAGQPSDKVIYFAVDFQAITAADFAAVKSFFEGVVKALQGAGYPVGVYGSYDVCNFVVANVPGVTYKWQTVAWSHGKECDYNLYQYQCDVSLPENANVRRVDLNYSNGAGGGWKVK